MDFVPNSVDANTMKLAIKLLTYHVLVLDYLLILSPILVSQLRLFLIEALVFSPPVVHAKS